MYVKEVSAWKDCSKEGLLLLRQHDNSVFEYISIHTDTQDENLLRMGHEVIFLDDYLCDIGKAALEEVLSRNGYSSAKGAYAAFCASVNEDDRYSTLALLIAGGRVGHSSELVIRSAAKVAKFIYDTTGLDYSCILGHPVVTDVSDKLKDIFIRKATCWDCGHYCYDDEESEESGEDVYDCDACCGCDCDPDDDVFKSGCGSFFSSCYDDSLAVYAIGKNEDGELVDIGYFIVEGISELDLGYKDFLFDKIKEYFPELDNRIIEIKFEIEG